MGFSALASFLVKAFLLLLAVLVLRRLLARRLPVAARFRLSLAAFLLLPLLALSSLQSPPSPFPRAAPRGGALSPSAAPIPGALGPGSPGPRASEAARSEAQMGLPSSLLVPRSLARGATFVWLAGLALSFASILASQYVTGRTVLRLPRCEDEGWLAALAAAKERFGLGRSVGLRLDGGRSPYSAGILRSVIAVPGSGRSWSQERKLAVMLHEAGHIRRGDTALLFIARLLAALVWPLPLAGLLLSRMAGDREEACDELALGHGADPLVFAELVLELATAKRPRPLPSALGMGQGSNIERRIIMILGHGIDRRKRGRGAAAGGLMALAILAFGVALIPSAFAEAPEAQERGPTGGDRISLASFDPASGVTNRSYDPATLPLGLPLAAGNWQLTQAFGEGPNPLTGKPYMHRGVDISDHRSGDPVLATFAGTVLDSGFEASAGYFVVLGNGAVSAFFSHLEKPGPAKGQRIEAGGLIGTVGLTGVATGPHLHYEVRVAGSFVDPLPLINARATILAGR